ncbi:hypothetical protein BDQ12DRAFT_602474 [Crucibulum laeve]|uniref:NAD(P)-binding domain-containing protein n=1 Tax=Crucibulum laeve TaxID=68775 RepID=A0A5C3M7A3_9AGAR|nr:hypothetical protein BDQ12DRAFT_602474 [Crucibulum laeve]
MHGHLTIKTHIFLTGATGYIGGSVLTRLLSHPLSDTFQTTVLVRDASKATQFRTMGIKAVVGTNLDLALIQGLAAEADLVIACADADDLDAAKAILRGLKKRYEQTGKVSSLIQTVSTDSCVLIDDANGMNSTENIYSDLDIAKLDTLPDTQPHRIVDLTLVEADREGTEWWIGYVNTYIILPSTIYGKASGPLVDAGLQNPRSQQIPRLVKLSLDRGRAGMVGVGKNVWPNVHIDEVANLYIILLDLIIPHDTERSPAPSKVREAFAHGHAGFYFAENGEHTLYSVSEAIGKAMVDLKKTNDPSPTTFSKDEMEKYFPDGTSLGTNSRCRAERSRKVGWKPIKRTKDMLASVHEEVEYWMKK